MELLYDYYIYLLAAFLLTGFLVACCYLFPFGLFLFALFSGIKFDVLKHIFGIRLRKVPPKIIISNIISATKFGLHLQIPQLEAHYLAGGNITNVVNALISAKESDLELSFQKASAIDLAGKNVIEAVQNSISPKSIKMPSVSAVAKDGVRVKVSTRITLKSNLNNIIGGAGADTIISRVGEAIITAIGSSDSHRTVLENPFRITEFVISKKLDQGAAFEIISVDIVGVKIGLKDSTQEITVVEEYDNVFPINGLQAAKQEFNIEQFRQFNVYNYNDFVLLLNNHIGLFKNTGNSFTIVSFKLDQPDKSVQELTLKQLLNSVRNSIGKRDKIYVNDNRIIVLLVSGVSGGIKSLIKKVEENIHISDKTSMNNLLNQISVFYLVPDSSTKNAESLIEYVLSVNNTKGSSYKPIKRFMA